MLAAEETASRLPLVLIVDDSETAILYLRQLLQGEFKVVTASNLIEFWAQLAGEPPDLVLMDVVQKEISGFELVRQIKRTDEYRNIPVIFVTRLDSAADIEAGFEAGCHDYVTKPVMQRELKARMRAALRLKNLEQELRMRSITDYLTGAYNRRYFYEVMAGNLGYAQRMKRNLCIAMLDIDFFKKVNDQHGHEAGDAVLQHFTKTIRSQIRKYDVLARFGGEEFVIQFFDCDLQKSTELLERVQQRLLETPCEIPDGHVSYTFSAGVACLHELQSAEPIDALIEAADRRLYDAKTSGRNRIIIFDKTKVLQ